MVSKEEILASLQIGQVRSDWLVVYAKSGYLLKQAAIFCVLALVILILAVLFISQSSYVFVPMYSSGSLDESAFQTWRYIDEAFLFIFFLACLYAAVNYALDLTNLQNQVLVLTSESFLLKKKKTEQFVSYAGVSSIRTLVGRYGGITLHIRAVGNTAVYKVQFDGRYGNARAVATQIVGAQRQYQVAQRARSVQS